MTGNQKIAHGLNGLLADAAVFYQKLRHYHWNVAGTEFFTLHAKFEAMYTAWADAIDVVAERILMIDGVPLHTLAAMLRETELDEDETVPAAAGMVDVLLADLSLLRARAGTVIGAAESVDDRGTVNVLDDLCDAIEKDAWMLRAWKKETSGMWA